MIATFQPGPQHANGMGSLNGGIIATLLDCHSGAAVHQLITEPDLSERKAYQVVELPRSTFRRPLAAQTPTDPDAGLRTWLCAFAKEHPRWGYRQAHAHARA